METFREKVKLILFSKNTTAFWNFLTKPTAGRFSKEIPKRCCNKKNRPKISVIFCRNFFRRKKNIQKKIDHLYRSYFFSRFRKSHLEQRAIFFNIRKTRPKKNVLFFRAIFHLAALRLVNLLCTHQLWRSEVRASNSY